MPSTSAASPRKTRVTSHFPLRRCCCLRLDDSSTGGFLILFFAFVRTATSLLQVWLPLGYLGLIIAPFVCTLYLVLHALLFYGTSYSRVEKRPRCVLAFLIFYAPAFLVLESLALFFFVRWAHREGGRRELVRQVSLAGDWVPTYSGEVYWVLAAFQVVFLVMEVYVVYLAITYYLDIRSVGVTNERKSHYTGVMWWMDVKDVVKKASDESKPTVT